MLEKNKTALYNGIREKMPSYKVISLCKTAVCFGVGSSELRFFSGGIINNADKQRKPCSAHHQKDLVKKLMESAMEISSTSEDNMFIDGLCFFDLLNRLFSQKSEAGILQEQRPFPKSYIPQQILGAIHKRSVWQPQVLHRQNWKDSSHLLFESPVPM